MNANSDFNTFHLIPKGCDIMPNDVVTLDKQTYLGFAIGSQSELSLVFLQTENWRISMDMSRTDFNLYMDSNFKKVSYRGLDLYPNYTTSSSLVCKGGQYRYYGTDEPTGEWQDINCRNPKGEDHSKSSDYTNGLKITYYFR